MSLFRKPLTALFKKILDFVLDISRNYHTRFFIVNESRSKLAGTDKKSFYKFRLLIIFVQKSPIFLVFWHNLLKDYVYSFIYYLFESDVDNFIV